MSALVRTSSEASAAIDVLHEVLDALRKHDVRASPDVWDLIEDRIAELRVKRDELNAAAVATDDGKGEQ